MINHGRNVQIVSFGSGLDTTWFNLMDEGFADKKFKFIELDLDIVVQRKVKKIKKSKKIGQLF